MGRSMRSVFGHDAPDEFGSKMLARTFPIMEATLIESFDRVGAGVHARWLPISFQCLSAFHAGTLRCYYWGRG